ncbi:uncharacterized protein FIBRA_05116 [Fibroporia radiculosa]|uniref:RlpA-like protein double-psi beta-barrel domain-containing protein n=1 Tax=Fibroporia radiculosa TaxID=599839 RepID=J4IAJ1_9APHY|nr:uncharacterized protein FIBRA_05116 [Fibroporia radiculosa]CCM03001.1 predicted protein [Fibroporia radiculosa]
MCVFSKSSVALLALFLGVAKAQTGTGTLFWFTPGVGACGFTNTTDQSVASVSEEVFNNYPGATYNPNDNPICHHNLTVTYNGTSVVAQIVDYYVSTPYNRVGLSESAFDVFAPSSQGIVPNVTWVVD